MQELMSTHEHQHRHPQTVDDKTLSSFLAAYLKFSSFIHDRLSKNFAGNLYISPYEANSRKALPLRDCLQQKSQQQD